MGSPQTQSFGFDALNRLTFAQINDGMGGTYPSETYAYDATTGNLASKAGVSYTPYRGCSYAAQGAGCLVQQHFGCPSGALSKAHAVTSAGLNVYCFDANGNQTQRSAYGTNYSLTYDAENRLVTVSWPGHTASFLYDGDGQRVQATRTPPRREGGARRFDAV
ncbi:MAG: hypothetical protein A2W36_05855 [Chloroflexi bacterium RBG_16_58_14]|nr:MAG: hypothetical protein A2W36_05855 [Chloroflexi bacterium RBG_16_58_14]